ncbi:MAG: SpoIIE family protein phosphatase [Candidatus Omnitrophica bacterium]|nr:SpoIIE family protein phosphatase [Candidatus Omnitrophota bacterium]
MKAKISGRSFVLPVFILGSALSLLAAYWLHTQDFAFYLSGFSIPNVPLIGAVVVGMIGFTFTVLLTVTLQIFSQRTERVRQLVEERTEELLRANRKLEERNLERERAETALEEERNLLKTLLDILPCRIFVKDDESRFVLANLAQANIFGMKDPDDIYGKTTFDFIPDEGSERRLADDREVMESGKSFINREEMSIESDGSRRWSLTTKVPLRNSQGAIIGLVGTSTDITERKLATEAVEQYAEQLRKKNAQMEDDLHMAREIQQAFIPQQVPEFPADPIISEHTVKFCHRYVPTATLAGDFFDILAISDEKVGIIICDVMGHGVRASLFTAYLRGLIEELRPVANDPASLLSDLNNGLMAILGRTGIPMFASAFYAVVDISKGRMSFASAGHPVPMRLHREKGFAEFLESDSKAAGPALGLFEGVRYTNHQITLDPNDLVLLYTDGLFEVHDGELEEYGEDRLLSAVQKKMGLSSDQMFDELLDEIRQFSATDSFPDDVCMVAIEFCGEPVPSMSGVRVGQSKT